MNHPTDDIDYLLECSRDALAEGNREAALSLLREAGAMAPLRRDIKVQIAAVLHSDQPHIPKPVSGTVPDIQAPTSIESASGIARRAIQFANAGTQQAGVATRRLSDLVGNGLKSWSTSLHSSKPNTKCVPVTSVSLEGFQINDAHIAQSEEEAFRPAKDFSDEVPTAEILLSSEQLSPYSYESSSAVVTKERTARKKKAEVEDYLATGMDKLLLQLAGIGKQTAIFSIAYALLILFTGAAYIMTLRSFPHVSVVTAPAAGKKSFNDGYGAAVEVLRSNAIQLEKARSFFAMGNHDQAVVLFEGVLLSETSSTKREEIKAELAGVFAARGSRYLQETRIVDSLADYRKAVQLNPSDLSYRLHLGNALYYAATFNKTNPDAAVLAEAASVLSDVISKSPKNANAHRMAALTNQAMGNRKRAEKDWENVLKCSSATSDLYIEATKALKNK